jgi:photosystem II stability/assembly factor-like uncharacterized protein
VAWTTGWEQGSDGIGTDLNFEISKTLDGGITWQAVTVPFENQGYLSSIWAINSEVAWVSYVDYTLGNLLYKTTDGGETWEVVFGGISVWIDFVYMWNEQEGIVFGDPDSLGFEIYTTQNGGMTWERNMAPPAPPEEFIYADNYEVKGNQIWVATVAGRIYYSPDRGISWEAWDAPPTDAWAWHVDVNDDGDVYLICLRSDSITNLVSEHELYQTKDKGLTWNNITAVDNKIHLNEIEAIPGTDVLMGVFQHSEALKVMRTRISYDEGLSWIEVDTQSLVNFLGFYSGEVGYASDRNTYLDPEPTKMYRYTGSPLTGLIKNTPLPDVEVGISPNPVADVITISLNANTTADYWILLNSISGALIYKETFSQVTEINHTIDLTSLPSGMYMVTVATAEGMVTQKFTKSN